MMRIAPALERRLAASPLASLSDTFSMRLGREALVLRFREGCLQNAALLPRPPRRDVTLPPHVAPMVWFGWRSIQEVWDWYPDATVHRPRGRPPGRRPLPQAPRLGLLALLRGAAGLTGLEGERCEVAPRSRYPVNPVNPVCLLRADRDARDRGEEKRTGFTGFTGFGRDEEGRPSVLSIVSSSALLGASKERRRQSSGLPRAGAAAQGRKKEDRIHRIYRIGRRMTDAALRSS